MVSKVVKPENLAAEFDVSGAVESGKIRLKLGAGLQRLADGTVITTAATATAYDVIDLGSQFLLDPSEINGVGVTGIHDPTHTQDLGNVGTTTVAWSFGGITRPWDLKLVEARIWYRINNTAAQAFGFFIGHAQKIENSTASLPFTYLLDEVGDNGGAGPRDPNNTRPYETGVISFANPTVIPAGECVTWGVAAPTADVTNRYVQISTGYLLFERV